MTIGIPRALLYFKYKDLWETFFSKLGFKIIISEQTNKKILNDGIRYSIDECCLPSKIYMGHVYSLIEKCDYILVPRFDSFGKNDVVCVKFNAMYDIVKNTFKNIRLIDYNLDAINGENELNGFIRMGRKLGKSYLHSLSAYMAAKRVQVEKQKLMAASQDELVNIENTLKILVVSHPYNIYDKSLGHPIIKQIKKLGGIPIYADAADSKRCIKKFNEDASCLYWTYSKELLGAISLYKDKVDGIILMTAFPCGPDSLVNELLIRRLKNIPVSNIVLDELQGEAGLQTRIESFIDIINEKRKVHFISLKKEEQA